LTQAVLNGLILYNSFLALVFFLFLTVGYILLRFKWAEQ
jgi:hypothetical protein